MRITFISLVLLGAYSLSIAQTPYLDSLTQVLAQSAEDTSKVLLLNELSAEIRGNDLQKSKAYAEEAIELASQINFTRGLKRAYYCLAGAFYYMPEYDSAKYYADKAIFASNEEEDFILINSAYGLLASSAFDQGNYEEAIKYNNLAIKVAEDHEDWEGVAFTCITQGNVQWKLNNYEKAQFYYKKALDEFTKIGHQYGMANSLSNLGNVSLDSSQRMNYHLRAGEIYKELGNVFGMATIDNNIGSFHHQRHNYDKAIGYYKKALAAVEDSDYREKKVQFYVNLGSAYGESGRLDSSLYWFDKAESLAKEIGVNALLQDTYDYMHQTFAEHGNYQLAYEAMINYSVIKDSIFQDQLAESLAESDARFKNSEQARTIAQNELELTRQRNARNLILFSSILAIVALIVLILWLRNRTRMRRREAQVERAEAEKLRELDRVKSNFFANISHEFRTPLTLIQGPLKAMTQGSFEGDLQKYYRIMLRNSERLLRLVNQLLDLSKLESGKTELEVEKGNIAQFLNAIANAFESMAARKQINYQIDIAAELEEGYFDRDKLEKILVNLLSNAFKFTTEEGQIHFKASKQGEQLQLVVSDNGIGIPADQLEQIFERFYSSSQHDAEMESSGIGLALTKELAELHGGNIAVKSEEGVGTTFTVLLPVNESLLEKGHLIESRTVAVPTLVAIPATTNAGENIDQPIGSRKQEIVLVVDDNEDVRNYVMDQLQGRYQLLSAKNGKEGLELAKAHVPGLILSDVMMPEMDGIEFSKAIRAEEATSHIPIILLTAKAERDDKLQGLETGAEDYLTKPFDAEELRLKVNNLVEQRKRWRARFSNVVTFKPKEMAVTSVDEIFLNRVASVIEENMDEELFGVPELAQAVGLSRSQLHRKLKALSDKSPSQIIREMRLQRAKELLEKDAGNASEVAFMVGFNSLAYFSKCFKDAYGYSPSEV